MFYEGLSKRFALRLLEIGFNDEKLNEFYGFNTSIVESTLFVDNFYMLRFMKVFIDNIKKTHKTLNYILKSQYKGASAIYETVSMFDGDSYDIWSIVQDKSMLREYFTEVCKYIIHPMMKRYSIYSQVICVLIFDYLYLEMLEEEVSAERFRMKKYLIINEVDSLQLSTKRVYLSAKENEMMEREISVWQDQKRRHVKKK